MSEALCSNGAQCSEMPNYLIGNRTKVAKNKTTNIFS